MKNNGHTVLITGGSSGIGLAMAERFLLHGNRVIAVGRDAGKLERLQARHPEVETYRCDLADPDQLDRLADWLAARHPGLDVLVNNAGIQYNYSFSEQTDQAKRVSEEISINLTAPIVLINRLLPLLARQPQAAIVNVSSGLGIVPKRSAPVYCATKAGLHLFTRALRYQLENSSVRVFELIPPVVDTEMTRGRGQNKLSPEALAEALMTAFEKDRWEVPVGKVKLLILLNRWMPALAARLLKNS